jgi:hypothetical protein
MQIGGISDYKILLLGLQLCDEDSGRQTGSQGLWPRKTRSFRWRARGSVSALAFDEKIQARKVFYDIDFGLTIRANWGGS